MFQSVDRYVDFITKNKLTQGQFLMLYLINRKNYDCIEKYKEAFPTSDGTMIGEMMKKDLIDRGFIKVIDVDAENTKADNYSITEKFTDLFIKDRYEAMLQLWDIYPGFVNINGNNIPLTNIDKYQLALLYIERIDYSVDEHKEILKDVKFGIEHNLIRVTIENFVRSEAWGKLRPMRTNSTQLKELTNENNF